MRYILQPVGGAEDWRIFHENSKLACQLPATTNLEQREDRQSKTPFAAKTRVDHRGST